MAELNTQSVFDLLRQGGDLKANQIPNVEITPEIRDNFQVLNPRQQAAPNGAVASREVPTVSVSPEGFDVSALPGTQIEGMTARGVPEPKEISGLGRAFNNFAKILETPGAQQLLAQLGIAFARGLPNQPGTILGQAALKGAEGEMQRRIVAGLLEGKTLDQIDIGGVPSPETITQAIQTAQQQQRVQQEGRRLDITEDIEGRRLGVQERANELQQQGIELDRDRFRLDETATLEDIELANAELTIAERELTIQEQLAPVQVELIRARAAALRRGPGADPEAQARLVRARNEAISTISQMVTTERDKLEVLEGLLEEDASITGERLLEIVFGVVSPVAGASLEAFKQRRIGESEFKGQVDRQRTLVEDLEENLSDIVTIQAAELGPGGEEAPLSPIVPKPNGGTTQQQQPAEQVQPTLGTRENPIQISAQTDTTNLTPGQIFINPNGILLEWTGTGFRRAQ